MRHRKGITLLIVIAVAVLFFWRPSAKGLRKATLEYQDRERTYYVHTPLGAPTGKRLPVVLAFHGRLGTGEGMAGLTHLNDVADKHGFLAVYPDGYRRSWADGRGTSPADIEGIDDIGFVRSLIERLDSDFKIDTARIFATGISNGGFFSQRIACDLSAQVAAVAGVASTLQESLATACKPQRSVPVLVMMGSKDPLVPWNGGALSGNRGAVLSAPEAARKWAAWDGCDMTPVPEEPFPRTHVDLYNRCRDGAEVALYRVEGGGHTWPGGRQYFPEFFVGKTSRDFDAGEVISAFFEKHPLLPRANSSS